MNIQTDWTDNDWEQFRQWIKAMLAMGPVTVTFTKKDGTDRVMKCTLKPEDLPPMPVKEDKEEKTDRKKSDTSLAVYDLEAQGWRSFVYKSVKSVSFDI